MVSCWEDWELVEGEGQSEPGGGEGVEFGKGEESISSCGGGGVGEDSAASGGGVAEGVELGNGVWSGGGGVAEEVEEREEGTGGVVAAERVEGGEGAAGDTERLDEDCVLLAYGGSATETDLPNGVTVTVPPSRPPFAGLMPRGNPVDANAGSLPPLLVLATEGKLEVVNGFTALSLARYVLSKLGADSPPFLAFFKSVGNDGRFPL